MKTLNAVLATTMLVLTMPIYADKDHHKEQTTPMPEMNQGAQMPMMNMQDMHKHMQDMDKTMQQMMNAKDNKERTKLMTQHMDQMHKGMEMMGPMMGNMKNMNPGQMMHQNEPMDDSGSDMMQRYQMMEQRMNMMQKMMSHMMEQQNMMMQNISPKKK